MREAKARARGPAHKARCYSPAVTDPDDSASGAHRKTKAWSGEQRRDEGTFPDGVPTPPPAPADDLSGCELAGRYRVIRKIGQGGMGEVYLGEHTTIQKQVAIKVLSDRYKGRRDVISRFLQEARAASSIRHENVVDITDFGETGDGQVFFVMEYLEGRELTSVMEQAGAMAWRRARELMLQILDALGAAHARGVIHRDMKPDNCFVVQRAGGRDHVKVLDFGIAKITTEDDAQSLTRTGVIMGTANYMSPEQAHGDRLDARTDIYSCGVILYEMLTGHLPFTGNNPMSVMYKHLHTDPVPPRTAAPDRGIPIAMEAIVMRALVKDPAQRFQSTQELQAALQAVPEDADAGPDVAPRARGRVPVVAAAIGVAMLLAGGGIWALAGREDPADAVAAEPAPAPAPSLAPERAVPAPSPTTAGPPASERVAPLPAEPPAAEAPAPERERPRGAKPIPAARSDRDIAKVVRKGAEPAARSCLQKEGAFPGERVQVTFSIGPDGRVEGAKAGRKHAGTPMGGCVEQAVRKLSFSPATEPQRASWDFSL
jgi:serine/threonine-protein kinase